MLQIYKKYLEKGVAFPCLCVALLSFRCRIGGGMRHLKGAIPDKNGSFLWYFTKISNSCFQSSEAAFVAGKSLLSPLRASRKSVLSDGNNTKKGQHVRSAVPRYNLRKACNESFYRTL